MSSRICSKRKSELASLGIWPPAAEEALSPSAKLAAKVLSFDP